MPVSNAWVGRDGPERRVDGLWPYHRAASEADGAVKYNDRSDAAEIVRAQNDYGLEDEPSAESDSPDDLDAG